MKPGQWLRIRLASKPEKPDAGKSSNYLHDINDVMISVNLRRSYGY